ncbi:DUF2196 domain-containing protein [Photobacterium chitinilyticum]|uniref:DUF2196 domain-containing protein n=1 Tax=Photobacterium chitinilyticum TaxID=2485123 RepID=A0A444JIK7_9GAMM|nr:DUF2196 domain-containing protein [Photobacterium chitinilyticum]
MSPQPVHYEQQTFKIVLCTNSPTHPQGIKVRLESGDVGRVKARL